MREYAVVRMGDVRVAIEVGAGALAWASLRRSGVAFPTTALLVRSASQADACAAVAGKPVSLAWARRRVIEG